MVSRQIDEPQWLVEETLEAIVDVIAMAMAAEENVTITGFGRFEARTKSAATKINPKSRTMMEVPARVTVVFLPSRKLKDRLNGDDGTDRRAPPDQDSE